MRSAGGRLFSNKEERGREEQRSRERVAEAAGRVAEVEAEIAGLEARHDALNADCRAAGAVAEAVMARVDRDEQFLRDELDWRAPGVNTSPALTGR